MKSLTERRAELVALLGEEKVAKYEQEIDEYILFGTRESRQIGEPKGLFGDAPNGGLLCPRCGCREFFCSMPRKCVQCGMRYDEFTKQYSDEPPESRVRESVHETSRS